MTRAVKNAHDEAQSFHYTNEALLINEVVFGKRKANVRETASEEELNLVAELEGKNATMIELEMNYQERKLALYKMAGYRPLKELTK